MGLSASHKLFYQPIYRGGISANRNNTKKTIGEDAKNTYEEYNKNTKETLGEQQKQDYDEYNKNHKPGDTSNTPSNNSVIDNNIDNATRTFFG